MKKIKLTKGYYTFVDKSDYDDLIQYSWRVNISKSGNKYAVRSWYDKSTKKIKSEKMHRRILKVKDSKIFVDHINGNSLDNQKQNLRLTNALGNARNASKTKRRKTTSKYRGVYWLTKNNVWLSRISVNKKIIHIGTFKNEISAAKAYDNAAIKYHKEFANLNFLKDKT